MRAGFAWLKGFAGCGIYETNGVGDCGLGNKSSRPPLGPTPALREGPYVLLSRIASGKGPTCLAGDPALRSGTRHATDQRHLLDRVMRGLRDSRHWQGLSSLMVFSGTFPRCDRASRQVPEARDLGPPEKTRCARSRSVRGLQGVATF